jgi:hypothetical protein
MVSANTVSDSGPEGVEQGEVGDIRTPRRRACRQKPGWHSNADSPPSDYYPDPLSGEKWQITWALRKAKFLPPKATTRFLDSRVADQASDFWGKQDGEIYHVYVNRRVSAEKFKNAQSELERIQEAPYRPSRHQLPRPYKKHRKTPLRAHDEEFLAHVLHEAGILETNSIDALRTEIRKEGSLFVSRSDDGEFAAYLSEEYTTTTVEQVINLRESMKQPQVQAIEDHP